MTKLLQKTLCLYLVLASICLGSLLGAHANTIRISVDSDGVEGNASSGCPVLSTDGQTIVFRSNASNLVDDDTNDVADVFVHERRTGQTTRVSVSNTGKQGNTESFCAVLSADGHTVVFRSSASNLVPGDTNGVTDAFVHDLQTSDTIRVSISSTGEQANSHTTSTALNADGQVVAFQSAASTLVPNDTNGVEDIFVHDRLTGDTVRVSLNTAGEEGNNASSNPSLSADGQLVAFISAASNLVRNDTNGVADAFVHDRQSGRTSRVSLSSNGEQANLASTQVALSAEGRFVAFVSNASNLVADDTNNTRDVFVHDRQTGETTRVSVNSAGVEANNTSFFTSISADGRFVALWSLASNLSPGSTNGSSSIFVHDRQTGGTTRASVDTQGTPSRLLGDAVTLSANGRFVAFVSADTTLVPDDTNGVADIFVHDRFGFLCAGRLPTILGTPQADTIVGTSGPDVIASLGGNDMVSSLGGDDIICGGPGNDILHGKSGHDLLLGEEGDDQLFGGTGQDRLRGGPGADTLDGGAGMDVCNGNAALDTTGHCEIVRNVP